VKNTWSFTSTPRVCLCGTLRKEITLQTSMKHRNCRKMRKESKIKKCKAYINLERIGGRIVFKNHITNIKLTLYYASYIPKGRPNFWLWIMNI
jgi:hypothetical protein